MTIAKDGGKRRWFRLARYLPGIIGAASTLVNQRREEEQARAVRRVEEQQQDAVKELAILEARIRTLRWIAGLALAAALGALAIALSR